MMSHCCCFFRFAKNINRPRKSFYLPEKDKSDEEGDVRQRRRPRLSLFVARESVHSRPPRCSVAEELRLTHTHTRARETPRRPSASKSVLFHVSPLFFSFF